MNSLPTLAQPNDFSNGQTNDEQFEQMLAVFAPELWRLWQYLKETNVNPRILPKIIRGISNISHSRSRVGRIIVFIEGDSANVQIREHDKEWEDVFS